MHFVRSIPGFFFIIVMAFAGQMDAQRPQPMHLVLTGMGLEAITQRAALEIIYPFSPEVPKVTLTRRVTSLKSFLRNGSRLPDSVI